MLFLSEASKRGFRGTKNLYRNGEEVISQIILEKSTYFPDNLFRLSLSIYIVRAESDRKHFHEIPDISTNEKAATPQINQLLHAALDADSLLQNDERLRIFEQYFETSAEPWFERFNSKDKIKEFMANYSSSDRASRNGGMPFRPLYELLESEGAPFGY